LPEKALCDPTAITLQKKKKKSNESENAKAESQAIDATRHL